MDEQAPIMVSFDFHTERRRTDPRKERPG
jgi:hypothetical protein